MVFGRRTVCIVFLAVILPAFAVCANEIPPSYNFYIFHNENSTDWENNPDLIFHVTVLDEGQGQVGFLFENLSEIGSSITDIYFDDGSLLSMEEPFVEGNGVSFSQYASPAHLPGGDNLTPPFAKPADFSADSDPGGKNGVSQNGVNPDEWLKIIFNLQPNRTYDDVLYELSIGGSATEDNLRIGLHIQSLPNDDSVSAINCLEPTTSPVPEPATIGLLALGSLVLIRKKR